jgi:two-component system, LuxR family, response regulator FixJ
MVDKHSPAEQRYALILDDYPAVRESLKFLLETEGFSVRAYADPAALLRDTNLPEKAILIANYHLPFMNGLDVIEELRRWRPAIPAILVTGHATDPMRERAARAGVPMLDKPFVGAELVECARRAIERLADPALP